MIETLPNQIMVGILPLIGISFAVKESIRKLHSKYGEKRIEVHHIQPRCRKGGDERENLVGLTVTEHAEAHWLLAVSQAQMYQANKDYAGVHLIVCRMTSEELNEFNRWLATEAIELRK